MKEPPITDQVFIRELTEIILANLGNEKFGVNELVNESGLSYYNLSQRIQATSRKTISQFIREVRLQKAFELLQEGKYSASEIAYKTGFGSPTYFNKCFREVFGFPPGKVKKEQIKYLKRSGLRKMILTPAWSILILSLIFITGFLIYKWLHKYEWTDKLGSQNARISLAVMPFKNITRDTIWDIWQNGIQERLISGLSNNRELRVRQAETINKLIEHRKSPGIAGISSSVARSLARKLDANIYINGSIRKSGQEISINAQLIDTRSREVIKSLSREGLFREEDIFRITDSLSEEVKDFLTMSKLLKENPLVTFSEPTTNSPKALRYYIYGKNAYSKKDYPAAISWYKLAFSVDSDYFEPMLGLSDSYAVQGLVEADLEWVVKFYKKRNQWPLYQQLFASWAYAFSFEPPEEGIKNLKQLQAIDDQNSRVLVVLGYTYNGLGQFDKAIPELEKSLKLQRKWGKKYLKDSWTFPNLGYAYFKTGQFEKAAKLYKSAEKYFQDNPNISDLQAILELAKKDTNSAKKYIDRYISIRKKNHSAEGDILAGIGWIYAEAGLPDQAENYYREAIGAEPENPRLMNTFAIFLLDNKRNPEEIPALMDKAMRLASCKYDYCEYSDTKARGLYKMGNNREALALLQKTWDTATFKMYFIKSHLDEIGKAVKK